MYAPSHIRVTSLEDPVSFSAECPWPPSRTNMVIATFCSETFSKDIDPVLCHQPAVSIRTATCSWSSRTFFWSIEAHSLLWLHQLAPLSSLLPNNAPTMGTVLLLRPTRTFTNDSHMKLFIWLTCSENNTSKLHQYVCWYLCYSLQHFIYLWLF